MRTPASPRPTAWVWGFARLAVTTFYRVERLGETLPPGPLLLVANHPNTLLDPALIQATAGRPIRFLAKSTLFRGHPMSLLVRRSGAIPVYRRVDAGVDPARNTETFAAVEAALADGEAICLFPEGLSHDRGRLEPLRTGAARMVLASGAHGHPVTIVPVGLNFERLTTFRSRATVVFGRPFDAADLATDHEVDPPAAVHTLTDRIGRRLRRLLIEADPRRELALVDRIDRLYSAARGVSRDPRARLARRRLIAEGMARLRDRDPARLADILRRVDDYDASLERLGLRERDVTQRIPFGLAGRFALREGLAALVLAPVAVVTLAVFCLPYWLTGRISRWAPNRQSRATWLVMFGVAIYGVWIGGLAGAVAARTDATTGALAAAGLVVLAFGGLPAVHRERAVLRTLRAFLALRQTPLRARATLGRQRAALADVLDEVRVWLDDTPAPPSPPDDRRL